MDSKGFATYLISKLSEASKAYESSLILVANKSNEETQNSIGFCRALRGLANDIPIHLNDFIKEQDDANNNIFSFSPAHIAPDDSSNGEAA